MEKEQKNQKEKRKKEIIFLIRAMEFGLPGEQTYSWWDSIFHKDKVKKIRKENFKIYKQYEKEYLDEH
jgi:hypothetical protein